MFYAKQRIKKYVANYKSINLIFYNDLTKHSMSKDRLAFSVYTPVFLKKEKYKNKLTPKDIYKEPLLHKHKILNLKNTKVKNMEPLNKFKNLYLVKQSQGIIPLHHDTVVFV